MGAVEVSNGGVMVAEKHGGVLVGYSAPPRSVTAPNYYYNYYNI